MGPLDQFRAELESRRSHFALRLHSARPACGLDQRYQAFHSAAARLVRGVIYPRLRVLRDLFPRAVLCGPDRQHGAAAAIRLPLTPRRPAQADIGLELLHDDRVETLAASYSLRLSPSFLCYRAAERFTGELAEIDEAALDRWVEDRLLDAVDTYLRLELVDRAQRDYLATDPVARVRFSKRSAVATAEHRGTTFYFVSPETHGKFLAAPQSYVALDD